MKLSDLKPCAGCDGPLMKPGHATWYVLRVCQAMLDPEAARETMALSQFFNGALKLAEVMGARGDEAVMIFGDKDKKLTTEIHLCFDCALKDQSILMLEETVAHRDEDAPVPADYDARREGM